ncbi:MAG: hypothetical protein ABEL76_05780 [Bradymonadaceae bacterium]
MPAGSPTFETLAATLIAVSLAVAGCSDDYDRQSPGGAYRAFRRAFIDADSAALWKRVDARTREYFSQRYQDLVEIDRDIDAHLPQTDQRLARKQSGAVLLDEIDGPRGLFEEVVRPKRVVVDRERRIGSEVAAVRIGEKQQTAVVTTRAGQAVRLSRNDDGTWGVDLLATLEGLRKRLSWIRKNRRAIRETVRSIMRRERERREEIIAELMDVQ